MKSKDDATLLGILSKKDTKKAGTYVKDVYSSPPVAARPENKVADAAVMMLKHKVGPPPLSSILAIELIGLHKYWGRCILHAWLIVWMAVWCESFWVLSRILCPLCCWMSCRCTGFPLWTTRPRWLGSSPGLTYSRLLPMIALEQHLCDRAVLDLRGYVARAAGKAQLLGTSKWDSPGCTGTENCQVHHLKWKANRSLIVPVTGLVL